jgi:hypothetical protein
MKMEMVELFSVRFTLPLPFSSFFTVGLTQLSCPSWPPAPIHGALERSRKCRGGFLTAACLPRMPQQVIKDKFTSIWLHSAGLGCHNLKAVTCMHYCLASATLPAGVPS